MRINSDAPGLIRIFIFRSLKRVPCAETAVSLAECCGVNRHTVAAHVDIIEAYLLGNRHTAVRFDTASERIDALALLREVGMVACGHDQDRRAGSHGRNARGTRERL